MKDTEALRPTVDAIALKRERRKAPIERALHAFVNSVIFGRRRVRSNASILGQNDSSNRNARTTPRA
jgi:hypothetical protein